jgi:hypothetical protein
LFIVLRPDTDGKARPAAAVESTKASAIPAKVVEEKKAAGSAMTQAAEKSPDKKGKRVERLLLYDGRFYLGSTMERGDEEIVFRTDKETLRFPAHTVREIRIIE